MGFYFRKSINFGGVRFNFSKSGVGVSTGVKGFRVGTGPRGTYVHMGRNGVYYKKTFSNKSANRKIENDTKINNVSEDKFEERGLFFEKIESSNVAQISDSTSEELLEELRNKQSLFSFKWLSLFFIFDPLVFIIMLSIFAVVDKKRKTTLIVYDIDKKIEENLQDFYDSFNELVNCSLKWNINAIAKNNDYKYNSGADNIIKRDNIKIIFDEPPRIKTNVKVPCIIAKNKKLCFLPDKLLIFNVKEIGALDYKNVNIDVSSSRFIESGIKPPDGTVVDYTWAYVNKNGGPDRRFSNNPRIPIMKYTEIQFYSINGLNEKIQLSKADIGNDLKNKIEEIKSNINFEKEDKIIVSENAKNDIEEINDSINCLLQNDKVLSENEINIINTNSMNECNEAKSYENKDIDEEMRKNNIFYKK